MLRSQLLPIPFMRGMLQASWRFEWAIRDGEDDPANALWVRMSRSQLVCQLKTLGAPATNCNGFTIFVPTSGGRDWFSDAARRGVKIQVLRLP